MRLMMFCFLLACMPLAAQDAPPELKVGDTIAEFTPNNWINPPAFGSFEELRGDVVLVFVWDKNVEACMTQLPAIVELSKRKGLHLVSLYKGLQKYSEIEAAVTKGKVTFPVALDSFFPAGYSYNKEKFAAPKFWIAGADGKLVFVGEADYQKILDEELAKVKYPGLGKDKVASAVEPAAKLFADGKYAEAHASAQKVYDAAQDKAAEDDADYLMKRLDARVKALISRAEGAEAAAEFAIAMRCWDELGKYKGIEDAAEAPARLKKLKDSPDVKKELAARKAWMSLRYDLAIEFGKVKKDDPAAVKKFRQKSLADYEKLAKAHKGTAVADMAEAQAQEFRDILADEGEEK